MSKVKAGGSVRQHKQGKRKGKSLGVKKFGGQKVVAGNIIIRQRGAKVKVAKGAGMGSDHTIFAMQDGTVVFGKKHGDVTVGVN